MLLRRERVIPHDARTVFLTVALAALSGRFAKHAKASISVLRGGLARGHGDAYDTMARAVAIDDG